MSAPVRTQQRVETQVRIASAPLRSQRSSAGVTLAHAAPPLRLHETARSAGSASLDCLTAAVYYEARSESADGQRAVAQVVLNRVRHPAFPDSVCGVVYQGSARSTGCQFTFTCDGSLRASRHAGGWARARQIASEALAGHVYAPVGYATHYHTNAVDPYWSSSLTRQVAVGSHIFYRWSGTSGQPAAFSQRASSHPVAQAATPQLAVAARPRAPAGPKLAAAPRPRAPVLARKRLQYHVEGLEPAVAISKPVQTVAVLEIQPGFTLEN